MEDHSMLIRLKDLVDAASGKGCSKFIGQKLERYTVNGQGLYLATAFAVLLL